MEKILMSGDEAIARGAWEAGVCVASAYPGTPSTEILENMAQYKDDLYCSWSNNEKTATEIAFGASLGGVRAMVSMKHVGMNVAADPIFTAAYTGVNGGLVIVSADDPGCYSSQNEQDNRLYALHARLGMLEPSDSQECLEYTKAAFELSEKFDLPMMIRVTTRVCHSKSVVQTGQRNEIKPLPYVSNPEKYAMLPANARVRHVQVEKNLEALKDYAETCALNKTIYNEGDIGIICSGICYMHAREAFGDSASYLKLAVTHPLPDKLIKAFCSKVKTVYIIEEGEPYLENAIKALGIECSGKNRLGPQGELDAQRIRAAFGLGEPPEIYPQPAQAPARPPVLCAGCPHRGFYFAMQKHKDSIVAIGDIGCYSLGVSAPFFGFEACICMGSGFSIPIGLSIALKRQGDKRKVIGILGDSTFYHSGFNSLVDAVHQMADVCLVILDNSITAMTGHQVNSGVERDLMGREVPVIPLEGMVMSAGLDKDRVRIVDPIDQQAMNAAIEAAVSTQGTFVIISRRPCALLKEEIRLRAGRHCEIDRELCRGCKACTKTACPSLAFEGKKAYIADAANCTGCGLCLQMCRFGAIKTVGG
ncbi:MAG: indolepyruvate ferredoxin oxidoreductase subunit alpha [Clostridiales bacterium]|nr:indolepyruvate ferredoxin oxidoreductase subunit alpha [Clostridiales bacterium]